MAPALGLYPPSKRAERRLISSYPCPGSSATSASNASRSSPGPKKRPVGPRVTTLVSYIVRYTRSRLQLRERGVCGGAAGQRRHPGREVRTEEEGVRQPVPPAHVAHPVRRGGGPNPRHPAAHVAPVAHQIAKTA